MSSVPGLNAAPSTAIRLPVTSPPAWSTASSASSARWPSLIASTAWMKSLQHVDAELVGPDGQRRDVLGQAAAAEAEPGVEELAADPLVVADRVGQQGHVAAGRLAHLGHRVDEADLGGQERVRGDLDQLGGGDVAADDRGAVGERDLVDLLQDLQGAARSGCRRPAGRGAGCPRPRTPRAGTPGSRPPRRRRRPAPARAAAPRVPARCRPARSTCRPPGRAWSAAGASESIAECSWHRSAAPPGPDGVPRARKCTSAQSAISA